MHGHKEEKKLEMNMKQMNKLMKQLMTKLT